MSWIDKLVSRSPIGPMQEHMHASVDCGRQVVPLVEAMVAGDDAAIASCRAEIDQLEHRADELKHEIRSHMPRRLLMAMERRDMLEILDCQDSIADVTQDIAELVRGGVVVEALDGLPLHDGPLTLLLSVRGHRRENAREADRGRDSQRGPLEEEARGVDVRVLS